jgi:hypothetical protein
MIQTLVIFVFMYVLLMVLPKYRAYIALASAMLFVLLGILPLGKVFSAYRQMDG